MPSATLRSKGRITVPIQVRNALRLTFGDRVDFVEMGEGRFLVVPITGSVRELKGLVPKPKQRVRIEDMNGSAVMRNFK